MSDASMASPGRGSEDKASVEYIFGGLNEKNDCAITLM